jgi:hypothetical protein
MAEVKKVTLKRFNGTDDDTLHPTTEWEQVENKPSTFTPTAHTLNSHTDVDANPTADGQVLTWDATNNQWIALDSTGGGDVSKADLQNVYVYGKADGAITIGQAVQFAGAQGGHILIKAAVPSEINAEPTLMIGIAETTLSNNEFGYVIVYGRLNLDTSVYEAGDLLYFASAGSTAGALTTTEPTDPNASIQMAAVSIDGVGNGEFIVRNKVLTRQINEVIGLQGALDSKVNKSGDTMSGALTIITDANNASGIIVEDNTTDAFVLLIPKLGAGGFNSLSAAGDVGLIFSTDANANSDDNNGLLIAPHNNVNSRAGLKIMENGNVGIGTSSPGAKLDINTGASSGGIKITADNTYNPQLFFYNESTLRSAITSIAGGNLAFYHNGGDKLVIDNSGNVGIGTTSPGKKLHIVGDARVEGDLTVNGTMTVVDTDVNTTEQWIITNDGTGPAAIINQTGAQPVIDIQDDGVSAFYIEDGGNVGIGTTDPGYKLEVNGSISMSGSSQLRGKLSNGTNTPLIGIGGDNTIAIGSGVANTLENIKFFPGGSEAMRIKSDGNVGIGTASPGAKLDVAGQVNVRGNILLTGSVTTADQGRTIDFTGFDKEGLTDFSDRAYIQHTTNTGGHAGSVLVISSQNDANDGIAFLTNATSKLKWNSADLATESFVTSQGYITSSGSVQSASRISIPDTRAVNDQPQNKERNAITADFKSNSSVSNPPVNASVNYSHIITVAGWATNEGSGGWPTQLSVGTQGIAYRQAISDTTWGSWSKMWHEGNDGSGSGLDADTLDGIDSTGFMYYRGIASSGDFQTFQSTANTVRFDQVNNTNNLSNKPPGYTYGGVISARGDNFGLQIWGSHTGDLEFKTQWDNDQYSGWRTIWHEGNFNPASYQPAGSYLTTSGKAADSELLDGIDSSSFGMIQGPSDYAVGTLVTTNIDYSQWSGDSFQFEIEGKSYGERFPWMVRGQGYIYSDTIINEGIFDYSGNFNTAQFRAFNHNGQLCFWWPRSSYWNNYAVRVYGSGGGGLVTNRVISVTSSDVPAGVTKIKYFFSRNAINSSNISSQSVNNSNNLGGIDSSRFVYGDGSRGRSKSLQNGNANTSDATNSSGFYFGTNVTGMPTNDWWNWMTVAGDSWSGGDGYAYQLANSFWSDDLRIRRLTSGSWSGWNRVYTDAYRPYADNASGIIFTTQPNTNWSGQIQLGGDGGNSGSTLIAKVQSTNGNLHLDPGTSKETYINHYAGSNTWINGNVGINHTTAAKKLDVNGGIRTRGSEYNQFDTWTDLPGHHGFYSTVHNGAHFYPNNGTYGAWMIQGTRNGWGGIEFQTAANGNVSLMIGTSASVTGFHNNNAGWQFRWESGTAYVNKGAVGGGTQATVWDSVNLTNLNQLTNGPSYAWVKTQGTTFQSGVNFTISGSTLYISTTA